MALAASEEEGEGDTERPDGGDRGGGGGDGEGGEGDCDPLVRAGGDERLDFEDLLDEVGVGAYQVCDAAPLFRRSSNHASDPFLVHSGPSC